MVQRKSFRECIRHFTWAWHTVVMSTGVLGTISLNFPYHNGSLPLKILTLFFFFLDLSFFIVICSATLTRYIMFTEIWGQMLNDPAQSLFLAAFPMGAVTIIDLALDCHQQWGFSNTTFLWTLWGFWILDCLLSIFVTFSMLYVMMTRQKHALESMAAMWLLPVVTLVVASSSGGTMAAALQSHNLTAALFTTTASFSILLIGLSLALMMTTVYLQRLILYGVPDVNLILSSFIVLGPLGQGGRSLLLNGRNIASMLPLHIGPVFPNIALTGDMIYAASFCGSFILWSMGCCWITIACMSIYNVARKQRIGFSMAYWGLIFPNGTFALCSVELGKTLYSPFFRVVGAMWSVIVLLLWIFVMVQTIPAIIDTSIFIAPYVSALSIPIVKHDEEAGTGTSTPSVTIRGRERP